MKKLTIAGFTCVALLKAIAATPLPNAQEIEHGVSINMAWSDSYGLSLRGRLGPVWRQIKQWEYENGFNWEAERDALTNILIRICALNVPTNDTHAYYWFCGSRGHYVREIFLETAEKADPFFAVVTNELSSVGHFEPPVLPEEFSQPMSDEEKRALNKADPSRVTRSLAYGKEYLRVMKLNESQDFLRAALIDLARPGVARRSAAMTDAEWTSFTNSVTTSAGLNKKEQSALFGSLRGTSDAP